MSLVRTGREFGTRSMRLLALRVIERRDREAALVLGDAMLERELDSIVTGRSRPVVWRTRPPWRLLPNRNEALLTREERRVIEQTRHETPSFYQPGLEVLFNVGGFARAPSEESWGKIWTMWATPRRGTYQAMTGAGILPRSIRFGEIKHENVPMFDLDVDLAYDLVIERTPPRRKRPQALALFGIARRESDNAHARNVYFDEALPEQLPLFGRDRRGR